MPRGFKAVNEAARSTPPTKLSPKSLLGWILRGADVEMDTESIKLTPNGRQPFMAIANLQLTGPIEVRIRIRSTRDGVGNLQWRTHEQEFFPEAKQLQSFGLTAGKWQEVKLQLATEGKLKHVRIFVPTSKNTTEIDWIEMNSKSNSQKKRWDFQSAMKPLNQTNDKLNPSTRIKN